MSTPRRLVILLLFSAGILNYMDRQIIAVLKPMLQDELGWSDGDYGHLTSLFQLASAIAFLVAGYVVDRLGWRHAGTVSVGSWSLAAMSHAFARSVGEFAAARVALGATEALATPSMLKTVATLFAAADRSLAIGFLNVSNNLGAVVTPLVIPAFALAYGWGASFLLVGGIGLVWVMAWIPVTRAMAPDQIQAGPDAEPPTRRIWRHVLFDRRTWAIGGTKALIDQVWWFMLFWTPDLFHRRFSLSIADFAVPLAVIYALAGFGGVLGGYVSGRFLKAGMEVRRARKMAMLFCAIVVLVLPSVLFVDDYRIAVLVVGIALAAHQGFSVNVFALVTDIVPGSRVATVGSIGALCGNLAGMASLQAAGWWIGGPNGYAPFLFVSAISYLLALAWFHVMAGPPGPGR